MLKSISSYLTLVLAIAIFSCSGKKFDYASAYKFNHKRTKHSSKSIVEKPMNLSVSNAPEIIVEKPVKNLAVIEQPKAVSKPVVKTKKEVRIEKKISKITKKIESRVERKIEKKAAAAGFSVTGKVYAGLVIGAAGLVLMILGGSALTTIGSIGLLVGVILIVWGLLE